MYRDVLGTELLVQSGMEPPDLRIANGLGP
jgi:hypothetical protein